MPLESMPKPLCVAYWWKMFKFFFIAVTCVVRTPFGYARPVEMNRYKKIAWNQTLCCKKLTCYVLKIRDDQSPLSFRVRQIRVATIAVANKSIDENALVCISPDGGSILLLWYDLCHPIVMNHDAYSLETKQKRYRNHQQSVRWSPFWRRGTFIANM